MHLSVIYEYPDVAGVRAGERALGHLVHDTLENRRHEAGVDGSADNTVVELKLSAPVEVVGLLALHIEDHILSVNLELVGERHALDNRADEEVNLSELSCSAGLLLVAVLGIGGLGNGLAVRDLRSKEIDLYLELVLKSPLHHIDMLLALSAENGLLQFLGVVHDNCRVLSRNLVESLSELGLVSLHLGLDGRAVLGCRELDILV